jgi:hypothetical protein
LDAAPAGRGTLALGGLAIVVAGAYAALLVVTQGEPLLLVLLVGALVTVAVFVRPIFGLYLLFPAAILFEQFDITGLAPLTAQTHYFQSLWAFSGVPIPLSASELLAIVTLVSWALRRLVGANAPARAGPFGSGIAAYGLAFAFGTAIGVARGGAWDASANVAEARAPLLCVCLLYFLTANLVHERRQLLIVLGEFILFVGAKAFQAIGNYAQAANGASWVEAVTAHEDVIFFDVAIALMLVMATLRMRGRLFYILVALQPVILIAELLTTRRVAFAVLATVLLVVTFMSSAVRPRATLLVVLVGALVFAGYAATFWDDSGPIAEPVRFIRLVVDPGSISDRDRGSNWWRDIETDNIAYTVGQTPLVGVGLGQEYLFHQEPPELPSITFWRYITHNALLWMWLKAGPYGAFALWFLVAQVVMRGLQLYRRLDEPVLRAAAAFPVLVIVAQVVFSSVDLGLTHDRPMTVLGVALGLAAPLTAWASSARGSIARAGPQRGGAIGRAARPKVAALSRRSY